MKLQRQEKKNKKNKTIVLENVRIKPWDKRETGTVEERRRREEEVQRHPGEP